jgi:hypothetical protein
MPNNENAILGPVMTPKEDAKYRLKSKWKSITIARRLNKVAYCVNPRDGMMPAEFLALSHLSSF